jgi:hypothetical protein
MMAKSIEEIVATGDLSEMNDEQRTQYYMGTCERLKLDAYSRPLGWSESTGVDGKKRLLLFCKRTGSDQLRRIFGISVISLERLDVSNPSVATYRVEGRMSDGRTSMSTASEPIAGKSGNALANALMSCESKAKSRLTLEMSGAGLLDEVEVLSFTTGPVFDQVGLGVVAYVEKVPEPSAVAGIEVASEPLLTPAMEKAVTEVLTAKPKGWVSYKIERTQQPSLEPEFKQTVTTALDTPVATPEEIAAEREALNVRIKAYKQDILPAAGIVASHGFGINAKVVRYFKAQKPDRASVDDFTNAEIREVLDSLDKLRATQGDKEVVKAIDAAVA